MKIPYLSFIFCLNLCCRSPNSVTVNMREAMAVSLVASYPDFSQDLVLDGDRPWVST